MIDSESLSKGEARVLDQLETEIRGRLALGDDFWPPGALKGRIPRELNCRIHPVRVDYLR
jgi:hypothetical protein